MGLILSRSLTAASADSGIGSRRRQLDLTEDRHAVVVADAPGDAILRADADVAEPGTPALGGEGMIIEAWGELDRNSCGSLDAVLAVYSDARLDEAEDLEVLGGSEDETAGTRWATMLSSQSPTRGTVPSVSTAEARS